MTKKEFYVVELLILILKSQSFLFCMTILAYRHFEPLKTLRKGNMQFKANDEIIIKLRNLEQEYGEIKEADDEMRLFLLAEEKKQS